VNQYYVYIMSSHRGTLYIGVTNDLMRRVYEHRHKLVDGFTSRYNVSKLVYYETTKEVESAIVREKQIKGWLRRKKVALIESLNPYWEDLAEAWSESPAPRPFALLQRTQGDTGRCLVILSPDDIGVKLRLRGESSAESGNLVWGLVVEYRPLMGGFPSTGGEGLVGAPGSR